ncbi:MAG: hypothetical protein PQJ60_10805 [Spirochaetales bacterium]|nr:hypothetical protein [Spirochaetales bacterium]
MTKETIEKFLDKAGMSRDDLGDNEACCKWLTCAAGMGVAGCGFCFLGGDPTDPDCPKYEPEEDYDDGGDWGDVWDDGDDGAPEAGIKREVDLCVK